VLSLNILNLREIKNTLYRLIVYLNGKNVNFNCFQLLFMCTL